VNTKRLLVIVAMCALSILFIQAGIREYAIKV
jgi:hypothetical protein